jgi:hypothetical protein
VRASSFDGSGGYDPPLWASTTIAPREDGSGEIGEIAIAPAAARASRRPVDRTSLRGEFRARRPGEAGGAPPEVFLSIASKARLP